MPFINSGMRTREALKWQGTDRWHTWWVTFQARLIVGRRAKPLDRTRISRRSWTSQDAWETLYLDNKQRLNQRVCECIW